MTAPPVPLRGVMTPLREAVVIDHDTGAEVEVGVDEATVTIDRGSVPRRVVDAHVYDVDPELLRAPHRLRLRMGYRVDGADYWASMAHVRIGEVTRAPLRGWTLRGAHSFETLVARARFAQPRTLTPGSSMVANLVTLIEEAVPWATVRVETTVDGVVPPGGVSEERERWDLCAGSAKSIATTLGLDVGCDGSGDIVIRDGLAAGDPWEVADTDLLVDWDERFDPSSVVNAWSCASDHPDVSPVWGQAVDDDPYSPTRVSRWGEVRQFHASPFYTEAWQCVRAASGFLATSRGVRAELDMTTAPNPWLDERTMVAATRDGVREVYALDRVVHDWGVGAGTRMTAAARLVSAG